MRAKNNKILPRLDSNSDRLDRRQHRLPLSHRVIFLFIGSVLINANRIHFILVNLLELMLKRPSQQLCSCRDVASISWDVHTKLGCHGIQNVLQIYLKCENMPYS